MESAPPTLLKEISCYVCIRYSIVCVFYPRFVSTIISIFAAMSSSSRSFSDATNTGRVKWFNSKYGYGFITLVKKAVVEGGSEADDEPRLDSDIFVHHSSINVASEQYRYLMQGEYVEFQIVKSTSDKYRFQAAAVSGCGGGKLMCETKKEMYDARVSTEPRTAEGEATERRPPTRRRAPQGDNAEDSRGNKKRSAPFRRPPPHKLTSASKIAHNVAVDIARDVAASAGGEEGNSNAGSNGGEWVNVVRKRANRDPNNPKAAAAAVTVVIETA